jgi:hypothetical protein
MQREFAKIIMIAGYDGLAPDIMASEVGIAREISASEVGRFNGANYGVIFSGDIRFTVTGRIILLIPGLCKPATQKRHSQVHLSTQLSVKATPQKIFMLSL